MNIYFINFDHFIQQCPFKPYKDTITNSSILQIKEMIKIFPRIYLLNNRKEMVVNLLKYNINGNWVDLMQKSMIYKRASCSLDGCISRYGDVVGRQVYQTHINKIKGTKEKYTDQEWKLICESKKSNLGLNGYIKKYGNVDGTIRWNEYQRKWKLGIEKRKKSGTWKNGRSLDEYQEKWGVEEGYKRWRASYDKRTYTLSLPGFIHRFGENEGTSKYYAHIEKMISNCRGGKSYSKISQELFNAIYAVLDEDKKNNTKYFTLNGEQIFYVDISGYKLIYVDFKCGNSIIEFDGDYWHSFPSTIKKDKIRDLFLSKKGYSILRVKEQDYLKNKKSVLEKCIKFINKNYERT